MQISLFFEQSVTLSYTQSVAKRYPRTCFILFPFSFWHSMEFNDTNARAKLQWL